MSTQPEQPDSRRTFLSIASGMAAAGMAAMNATAQNATPTPAENDLAVLSYVLALQHVEAAFYAQAVTRFKASDFSDSAALVPIGIGLAADAHNLIRIIADQERSHVGAMQSLMRSLRGPVLGACTYDFKYETVPELLQSARSLEALATQSLVGAVALLQIPSIRATIAGIATAEARHSGYINLLNAGQPFPGPIDDSRSAAQVEAGIKEFLVRCGSGGEPTAKTTAVLNPKNLVTAQYEILLDATASSAANKGALKFLTKHAPGGKIASIYDAETGTPRVQFNEGSGTYNFELTVTDSTGATATDTTSVSYIGR